MKQIIKSIIYSAIAALSIIATIFVPFLSLIFILSASIFSTLAIIYGDKKYIISSVSFIIILGILVCIIKSLWISLLLMLLFIPSAVALGLSYKKNKSINYAAMATVIIAIILSITVMISFIAENTEGFNVNEAITKAGDNLNDLASQAYNSIYDYSDSISKTGLNQYKDLLDSIGQSQFVQFVINRTIYFIPTALMMFLLSVTAACYYIIKHTLKITPYNKTAFTDFDSINISRTTGIVYGIIVITYLIASLFSQKDSVTYMVLNMLDTIFSTIFFFAGLSVADFYFKHKNLKKTGRVFLIIGIAFVGFVISPAILGLVNTLIIIIGWSDSLSGIRKLLDGGGKI